MTEAFTKAEVLNNETHKGNADMRGKRGAIAGIPPQLRAPLGIALIFIGLYLLNQQKTEWGIASIIVGVLLVSGHL